MNRFIIVLLILLSGASVGCGQSPVETLSKKFEAWQSLNPKAKLHLIFNQDKFTPGDTAWFKAYFLTEDLKGIPGKQLIDLNLVDSRGVSLHHLVFSTTDGIGQNQLAIPDTLSPGIYLVTAHSSWMKNFDPIPVFKKEISIVGKNRIETVEPNKLIAATEGKHLVANVFNKVAIQTSPETAVQLVDAEGKEISRTVADRHGVGSIMFKPQSNVSYYVRNVGGQDRFVLPATEEDGCSLQFQFETDTESIKLNLAFPPGSMYRNQELVVMMTTRGKVYHGTAFMQGTKEEAIIQIPIGDLPEGRAHLSLLTSQGKLLASRDFYRSVNNPVSAKILAAKPVFNRREKASVEVSLQDNNGQPVMGEFSINVVNSNVLENGGQNLLSDDLSVLSGLAGNVEIDRTEPDWLTRLDHYMILTTEDLPWDQIMQPNIPAPRFPFTNVVEKSGRAYLADSGEPLQDKTQIMFYLQRSMMHYQTLTREKGKVALAIGDLYGDDEFFYLGQANGMDVANIKIKWDDDSIRLPHAPLARETEIEDAYASFMLKKRLIDQSFGFYKTDGAADVVSNQNNDLDFEEEVAEADTKVNMADYILFPTMAELLKEIVPSAYYRENRNTRTVRVQVAEPLIVTADPLYIIDGVATKNTEFFLSLKPSDLISIGVINKPRKLFPLGLMGKNGIIIVHTKKGDAREPLVDPSRTLKGINPSASFKTIKHLDVEDLRKPDFRSTLYWNPSTKTDSTGKARIEFFCSDDIGKIEIRIDGLTTSGKPFTSKQSIEIGTDHK